MKIKLFETSSLPSAIFSGLKIDVGIKKSYGAVLAAITDKVTEQSDGSYQYQADLSTATAASSADVIESVSLESDTLGYYALAFVAVVVGLIVLLIYKK